MAKENIGIVGAGRMGLAMLKHLVKKGYAVTICDTSDKAVELAKAAGAGEVKTPAELAIKPARPIKPDRARSSVPAARCGRSLAPGHRP